MPRVLAIHLRPGARLPVRTVDTARAVLDVGLEGDHAEGGRRQVTLLDVDRWRAACAEVGADLDPAVRRANLVLEGVDLTVRRGARLRVGEAEIEIVGETRPCEILDDGDVRERTGGLGISGALRADARGGVHGRVVRAGTISVGDPADWLPDAPVE